MKLLLSGGGSGEQNYYLNKKLSELIDNNKKVLYIPLAMDEDVHPYDECYDWIIEELNEVPKAGIDMVRSFEELASKDFNTYGAIYIGGGNTYKLLKGLKETDAISKLKDYLYTDGIIVGGSAGSVIFGKDIDIVETMDRNLVNLEDTEGLNIMDGMSFFPHYTNRKSKLTEEENIARYNRHTEFIKNYSLTHEKVIALPEEDALYINDDEIAVIGTRPFYYCANGEFEMVEIDVNKNFKKIM